MARHRRNPRLKAGALIKIGLLAAAGYAGYKAYTGLSASLSDQGTQPAVLTGPQPYVWQNLGGGGSGGGGVICPPGYHWGPDVTGQVNCVKDAGSGGGGGGGGGGNCPPGYHPNPTGETNCIADTVS